MAEGDSYATLLQPIRDLAQNWSIDVASALGDYLEELDGITVTSRSCGRRSRTP